MIKKPIVVFLASGYPTPDNPSHGIFNKRAAELISKHVSLTVIQFRIYKPGRKLVEKIAEKGFNRIILCVPYSPVAGRRLYYQNTRMFYYAAILFVRKVLANADLIHAGDGNMAVLATWLKHKYGCKVLGQFIGGDINNDLPVIMKKKWMRNFVKDLDGASFNSKASNITFNRLFGSCKNERVIYRGVDTEVFQPIERDDDRKEIKFYFLGGLPNYSHEYGRNTKGGYFLMEAWEKLEKEFTHISLQFAGPDGNIDMAVNWRGKLNRPEKVFLSARLNPEKVPAFHQNGDVCLIPSLAEGLPNVAMEAMSTGNLVIATQVGGIPELISDSENGILCAKPDSESLYLAMKYVIQNPNSIALLGNEARRKILSKFSSAGFGEKYVDYYREILG